MADLIAPGVIEELLAYPVTAGATDTGRLLRRDRRSSTTPRRPGWPRTWRPGRDVVVLAEGDPLFYSSYMYLHDRLAERFRCEIVPGVTSVSAASAAAATPLVRHEDVLTVLPGTLPVPELARRLADTRRAR